MSLFGVLCAGVVVFGTGDGVCPNLGNDYNQRLSPVGDDENTSCCPESNNEVASNCYDSTTVFDFCLVASEDFPCCTRTGLDSSGQQPLFTDPFAVVVQCRSADEDECPTGHGKGGTTSGFPIVSTGLCVSTNPEVAAAPFIGFTDNEALYYEPGDGGLDSFKRQCESICRHYGPGCLAFDVALTGFDLFGYKHYRCRLWNTNLLEGNGDRGIVPDNPLDPDWREGDRCFVRETFAQIWCGASDGDGAGDPDGDPDGETTTYSVGDHGCENQIVTGEEVARPQTECYVTSVVSTVEGCEAMCEARRDLPDEDCGAFDFTPTEDPDVGNCCVFGSYFYRPSDPGTGNEPAGRQCHYFRRSAAIEFEAYINEILNRLHLGTSPDGNPRPTDYDLTDNHWVAFILQEIAVLQANPQEANRHRIVGKFSNSIPDRRRRDLGLLRAGCHLAPFTTVSRAEDDLFVVFFERDHGNFELFLCDCDADIPAAPDGAEYLLHNTCFEAAAAEDGGNGDENGDGDGDGGGGNGDKNGDGDGDGGGGGSSDTSSETTGGGLDGGAIAGIVVGSLAGVGLIWFGLSQSGVLAKGTSSSVTVAPPFYSEESRLII
jgi:hypothetical protein